ncbi:MAG: hypothetical protein N3G21_03310 [Candidatus Hydrogenedentes bacterium]|nr:hypothetical protein [Candidatus Hydrogenedentota bacterium]
MKFLGKFLSVMRRSLNLKEFVLPTIRTRNLILEDEMGNKKAELFTDNEGNVVLRFVDKTGQCRLFVGLTPDGTPRIGLTYGNGKGSIQLEANDKLNSSAIVFCGPEGRPQILLGIANTGLPALGLYNKDGKLIFPNLGSISETEGRKGFGHVFSEN